MLSWRLNTLYICITPPNFKGLCWTKSSSETLQILPYFICYKRYHFQFANRQFDNMSFWEWKYDISQYDICHPNKIYANSIFFGYLNLKLVIFHLYLYERFRGYSSSLFRCLSSFMLIIMFTFVVFSHQLNTSFSALTEYRH